MQSMPSVQNQMPSGAPHPLLGNGVQKESAQLSVHDIEGTSALPSFPNTFHDVLQSSLCVREKIQDPSGGAGIRIQERTPDGSEKGFIPSAANAKSTGKKSGLSSRGLQARLGNHKGGDTSLDPLQGLLPSSRKNTVAEEAPESLPSSSQGVTEGHRLMHGHQRIRGQRQVVSENTADQLRSCCRDLGEKAAAAEEKNVLHGRRGMVRRVDGEEVQHSEDIRDDGGRVHDHAHRHEKEMNGRTGPAVTGHPMGLQPNASAASAVTAAVQSRASDGGEKAFSSVHGQGVSPKNHSHLKSGHLHRDVDSADHETIDVLYGKPAQGGTESRGEAGLSVPSLPKGSSGGVVLRGAAEKKVSPPPNNSEVPGATGAPQSMGSADGERTVSPVHEQGTSEKTHDRLRAGHRHTGDQSVASEEKSGARGTAVAAGMDGSAEAGRSDDVRDITGRVHNLETGRERQQEGHANGLSAFASVKETPSERFRSGAAAEKTLTLQSDLVFQAVDGMPASASSDDAEGIHAPGRQPELLGQVVENTRTLMQQGGGRVLISLNPPRLGALDIDVRVTKDGIELYMVVNSSDVKHTLYSHVEQLRSALGEQGLNMDRFQVVVGDRPDGQTGRDPRQEGMTGGEWEARSEQGSLPRADGDARDDEVREAALFGPSPSVGVINVFI